MTPEQALGAIQERFGYVVVASSCPRQIHEVIPGEQCENGVDQPIVVVGETTREEYLQQTKMVDDLLGISNETWVPEQYFYRVMAE